MNNKHLATPYLLWMCIFTIVPLCIVFYFAFTNSAGEFTLANIIRIGRYMPIFYRSIALAAISAVICFLISYPVALYGKPACIKAALCIYAYNPSPVHELLAAHNGMGSSFGGYRYN